MANENNAEEYMADWFFGTLGDKMQLLASQFTNLAYALTLEPQVPAATMNQMYAMISEICNLVTQLLWSKSMSEKEISGNRFDTLLKLKYPVGTERLPFTGLTFYQTLEKCNEKGERLNGALKDYAQPAAILKFINEVLMSMSSKTVWKSLGAETLEGPFPFPKDEIPPPNVPDRIAALTKEKVDKDLAECNDNLAGMKTSGGDDEGQTTNNHKDKIDKLEDEIGNLKNTLRMADEDLKKKREEQKAYDDLTEKTKNLQEKLDALTREVNQKEKERDRLGRDIDDSTKEHQKLADVDSPSPEAFIEILSSPDIDLNATEGQHEEDVVEGEAEEAEEEKPKKNNKKAEEEKPKKKKNKKAEEEKEEKLKKKKAEEEEEKLKKKKKKERKANRVAMLAVSRALLYLLPDSLDPPK